MGDAADDVYDAAHREDDEEICSECDKQPVLVDDAMVERALQGFDTGTGDPNDYRKRMRAALEAALNY